MPHFFINSSEIKDNKIEITDRETVQHLAFSLRLEPNEKLLLIDENEIQYETQATKITPRQIEATITKSYKSQRTINRNIVLAQCVLKLEAQNLAVQKATELGIKEFIPILSDKISVKQSIINSRLPKWQKIAQEAAKQCERANIPSISQPKKLLELLNENKSAKILAMVEKNASTPLKNYLKNTNFDKNDKLVVIIGPEGGFSDKEFDLFMQQKLPMLSLSNLIMKAETASACAISNIIYELE